MLVLAWTLARLSKPGRLGTRLSLRDSLEVLRRKLEDSPNGPLHVISDGGIRAEVVHHEVPQIGELGLLSALAPRELQRPRQG